MTRVTRRQHGSGWRTSHVALVLVLAAVAVGLVAANPDRGARTFDRGFSWGSASPSTGVLDECMNGQTACTVILVVDGVRHTWVGAGAGAPPVAADAEVLPCAAASDGGARAAGHGGAPEPVRATPTIATLTN